MATAAQIASAGVYVTDDIGLEVTDGASARVQLGLLPTNVYGLRVVAADGTTVIIDGTSDMFKILATGTTSVNEPTGFGGATVSLALPALGTFTTTPAYIDYHSSNSGATASKRLRFFNQGTITIWAAALSGGPTTTRGAQTNTQIDAETFIDGFNNVDYQSSIWNTSNAAVTDFIRYYILVEAAM